jgi:exodeoxyribonuclease VII large subunit
LAANQSTPETPFQVSYISQAIHDWVAKLGSVWVEGELTSYDIRGGHAYAKIRDLEQDASLSIVMWRSVRERLTEQFKKGDRVIINAKPDVWVKGGSLSLQVYDMRHVGIGTLLEQLERLRRKLGEEGLFDLDRKRRLPFLPNRIGLITGRDSDAEKDVRRNAELRWPAVQFRTEYARVQGDSAAAEVVTALRLLDVDPEVDVIIIARGGGDFLHLLPFSDETLVRAAAAANTPIVSAIGHEADRPILDEVADLRASTPTDAAKRVVPDVAEQLDLVSQLRARIRRHLTELVRVEGHRLEDLRSRPALANPSWMIDQRGDEVGRYATRANELMDWHLRRFDDQVTGLGHRLAALSPLGTLQRGYAIVERVDGESPGVVATTGQVEPGAKLNIRVTDGRIEATVE